eukprot:m.292527 g.292527  ORF g.292527 m.292527 type:complete len:60 (+) comp17826_c0_seq12:841-1020(+)
MLQRKHEQEKLLAMAAPKGSSTVQQLLLLKHMLNCSYVCGAVLTLIDSVFLCLPFPFKC